MSTQGLGPWASTTHSVSVLAAIHLSTNKHPFPPNVPITRVVTAVGWEILFSLLINNWTPGVRRGVHCVIHAEFGSSPFPKWRLTSAREAL